MLSILGLTALREISTMCEVALEPLLLDGSNYASWSTYMLSVFRTMGPQIERIVDVSISPLNYVWENLSSEKMTCLQLNAQASYALLCALSPDVSHWMRKEHGPLEDAHLIWTKLKEKYELSKCDDVELSFEDSLEECSTSTNCEEPQVTLSNGQDNLATPTSTFDSMQDNDMVSRINVDASISYHTCETNILKEEEVCGRHRPSEESTSRKCSLPLSEARMCLMASYKKRPAKEVESESDDESESEDEIEDEDLEIDHLSKKDKLKVIKLLKVISSKVNKLRKMEEKLDNQEDYLIKKIEELKALTEKHEKLKCSHATLVDRYAKASIELTCATNSISCVTQLEKANSGLKAQNEELASKYVALQENHGVLLCSHEKLVDSHAMIEIAHEVVLSMVKSHQPLTHKCTCSQVQIDLSCANPCCSQEKQSSVEH